MVTHVRVNEATRGYGIFIENMLEAAGQSYGRSGLLLPFPLASSHLLEYSYIDIPFFVYYHLL